MSDFRAGEDNWIDRLGNLRNVIRQEVIRRQLADHVEAGDTVLDVGCGQGTQAVALARLGCRVTGVEPSPRLRELCAASARDAEVDVELIVGSVGELDAVLGTRSFDLVCSHGLLMYLSDPRAALGALAAHVNQSGRLSVTARNRHALALRPALRGEWGDVLAAFGSLDYRNDLGVDARADLIDEIEAHLDAHGFGIEEWYGVRVLNDGISADRHPSDETDLDALLEAEDRASRLDPYRWIGAQLHVVARRSPSVR